MASNFASTNLNQNRPRSRAGLDQVNQLAWLLDNSIKIPLLNYRIGLDAIIGLIPGVGDLAGVLLSSWIVIQAIRLGAPGSVLLRMVLNIGIEALIGFIPVLGDLFDTVFKANARNAQLLAEMFDSQRAAPIRRPSKGAIALIISALAALVVVTVGIGWALLSLLRSLLP